jgi:hypothetical protein
MTNPGLFEKIEFLFVAPNTHTISVDTPTHLVYLPLKSVGGRPVLRIMNPIYIKGGSLP